MDKLLAIINILVFGILFLSAFNSFCIKKKVNLELDNNVAKVTIIVAFVVILLPVILGLVNLF